MSATPLLLVVISIELAIVIGSLWELVDAVRDLRL